MSERVPYAVTGATGGIGGRVAALLAEAGQSQRLIVRDPSRAPDLPGASVAEANYGDGEALRRALDGAEALLLVSAAEAPGRVALHTSVVDAAVAAGVQRVVYTSFLGASPTCTFTFGRHHWATEEYIRNAGIGYTFLRDALYLDFLPFMAGADGVIRGPAGDGRVGAVTRDDVAAVAATALLHGGHGARTYDLTGPEAISMARTAELLGKAAGRPVTFVNETLDEAYASRAQYEAPDFVVEGWVTTYTSIAAGEQDTVSDAVATVTGRPPMGLAEFLERHPESLDHLRR
jgi:uncharacterized protein YbjT (DUF2867 family)